MTWRALSTRPYAAAERIGVTAEPEITERELTGNSRQGLTLVHFSAQPEPFLTHETTLHTLNTPSHPLNTP